MSERWANNSITEDLDVKFRDFYKKMDSEGYYHIFNKYGLHPTSGAVSLREDPSKNLNFDKLQFDSLERLMDGVKSLVKRN
jgi:hypothetical protein